MTQNKFNHIHTEIPTGTLLTGMSMTIIWARLCFVAHVAGYRLIYFLYMLLTLHEKQPKYDNDEGTRRDI